MRHPLRVDLRSAAASPRAYPFVWLIQREARLVKLTETTYSHIITRLSSSYDLAIMDTSRIHTLENAYAAKYMLMELHRLVCKQLKRLRTPSLQPIVLEVVRARLKEPESFEDMSVSADKEENDATLASLA